MSNVDKFRDYLKLLDEKEAKIKELKDAVNSETSLKLELLHKSNDVKLHPNNVKEEYELSKAPTEKQIQAHIDETYKENNELHLPKRHTSTSSRRRCINYPRNVYTY